MIIVSQKKDEIINFENVMNICVTDCDEDGYGIFAGVIIGIDDNYRELGMYKTEKRAIEVLVEIATAYTNMKMLNIPIIDVHEVITSQRMAENICFEMPEE